MEHGMKMSTLPAAPIRVPLDSGGNGDARFGNLGSVILNEAPWTLTFRPRSTATDALPCHGGFGSGFDHRSGRRRHTMLRSPWNQ